MFDGMNGVVTKWTGWICAGYLILLSCYCKKPVAFFESVVSFPFDIGYLKAHYGNLEIYQS